MSLEKNPLNFETFWNFNLQASSIALEEEKDVIEKGYKPLIMLYDKHPSIKADVAFTGYTSIRIAEHAPEFVDVIKSGVKRGQFNLMFSAGYAHAMVSLLPYEDVRLQLERGLDIHRRIWGSNPEGYHCPEGQFDFTLPKLLTEVGVKWAETGDIIYKESPFEEYVSEEDLYRAVYATGIEGSKIPIVFSSRSRFKPVFLRILRHENVTANIKEFIRMMDELQKLNKNGDLIISMGMDPELIHYMDPDKGFALDRFMTALEKVSYLKFVTFDEYLRTHKPSKTVSLKTTPSSGAGMAFDVWLKGSEKLDTLCNRAREQIHIAESIIMLAEKLGFNVSKAKTLLDQAWDHLLLSEDSDARSAASVFRREFFMFNMGTFYKGATSRSMAAYENALKALELSKEAIAAIEGKQECD